MKRDLARLAGEEFDLLVIGGGAYGAAVAWDATVRGLSVALVEKGDFAGGTSSNSLKVVHGGLRYLQDGNLQRMRTMVRERRALLRIAPHLVRPLPFLFPSYGHGLRSHTAFRLAMLANEWIGQDRNRDLSPATSLPESRVISREEFLDRLPRTAELDGVSGAALWFDAQISNTERLVISFLKSAYRRGASLANYLAATGLTVKGQRVTGATVEDRLSGDRLEVRAKVTVNAAGPWVDSVLGSLPRPRRQPIFHPSLAMNLVTRQLVAGAAIGLPALPASRDAAGNGQPPSTLFIVPWKTRSLIGTVHTAYRGDTEAIEIPGEVLRGMLDRVNQAFPGVDLSPGDISLVHRGLLPALDAHPGKRQVVLTREGWLVDHRQTDGYDGLMTIVGVKLTACRDVAEKTVDQVFAKLGRPAPPCRTESTVLVGGEGERLDEDPVGESLAAGPGAEAEVRRTYGGEYPEVLKCLPSEADPHDALQVLEAQAIFAVRDEMAQRLSDVVLRRTDIGAAGRPDEGLLKRLAGTLAAELGWNEKRVQQEMEMVRNHYAGRTG